MHLSRMIVIHNKDRLLPCTALTNHLVAAIEMRHILCGARTTFLHFVLMSFTFLRFIRRNRHFYRRSTKMSYGKTRRKKKRSTPYVVCFVGKTPCIRVGHGIEMSAKWLESRTANKWISYPTPGTILLSFLQFHNPDTFQTSALHLSQPSFFVSTPGSLISHIHFLYFPCGQLDFLN